MTPEERQEILRRCEAEDRRRETLEMWYKIAWKLFWAVLFLFQAYLMKYYVDAKIYGAAAFEALTSLVPLGKFLERE